MWHHVFATRASFRCVGNFAHISKRGLEMTIVGVLVWFAALMIGFFIGLKMGNAQ